MKDNQKYENGRQLRIEDYLQENKLETEGNVEVPSIFDVSSKEEINTKTVTNELLEKILSKDNMNLAYKRVKANKGANGIDNMQVDELLQYLKENGDQIKEKIRKGKYNPKAVRRVEIPKADGSKRKLGIPTVVDRVITSRSNTMSMETRYIKLKQVIVGWINYFKIANMGKIVQKLDEWIRRRLRMCYWKQWKKIKTKHDNLIKLGINKYKAWEYANTRKSY